MRVLLTSAGLETEEIKECFVDMAGKDMSLVKQKKDNMFQGFNKSTIMYYKAIRKKNCKQAVGSPYSIVWERILRLPVLLFNKV